MSKFGSWAKGAGVLASLAMVTLAQAAGEVDQITQEARGWQISGVMLAGVLVSIAFLVMGVLWSSNNARGGSLVKPIAFAVLTPIVLAYIASKFA